MVTQKQRDSRKERYNQFTAQIIAADPRFQVSKGQLYFITDNATVRISPSYSFNYGRFGSQSKSWLEFSIQAISANVSPYDVGQEMSIKRQKIEIQKAYGDPKKLIAKAVQVDKKIKDAANAELARKAAKANKEEIIRAAFVEKFGEGHHYGIYSKSFGSRVDFKMNGNRYSFDVSVREGKVRVDSYSKDIDYDARVTLDNFKF